MRIGENIAAQVEEQCRLHFVSNKTRKRKGRIHDIDFTVMNNNLLTSTTVPINFLF